MKYFTIAELSRSTVAAARNIDNTPPAGVRIALTALVDRVLDPVREAWGRPLTVNSGYRSLALNAAAGGASTSQHLRGEAADITAGSAALNKQLFDLIVKMAADGSLDPAFEFDQLIDERGYSWIHVSYRADGRNRNQKLHIK